MIEFDKELIEDMLEDLGAGNTRANIRSVLESFLPVELPPCPVELPPCPVCGEEMKPRNKERWYWVSCAYDHNHIITERCHSEQKAIDAYLATPWCRMWLEHQV